MKLKREKGKKNNIRRFFCPIYRRVFVCVFVCVFVVVFVSVFV